MPKRYLRQHGQVMIFTLMFGVVALLGFWMLYDVGQTSSERIRLQNNVDSTAYSTGVIVARDLNFMAYTNRAMVANQVAVAQLVGINSWIHFIDKTASNIDTVTDVLQFVPYIGQIINQLGNALDRIANAAKRVADQAIPPLVTVLDTLILTPLSISQDLYGAATYVAARELYKNVSKDNDAKINHSTSGQAFFLGNLAKEMSDFRIRNDKAKIRAIKKKDRTERARFIEMRNVTMNSRDPFTDRRSYSWLKFKLPFPVCLGADWRKYGGSDLVQRRNSRSNQYVWDWTSMDDASIWLRGPKLLKCSSFKESLPTGWGAAHALQQSHRGNNYNYRKYRRRYSWWGNGAWRNRISANLAYGADRGNAMTKRRKLTHSGLKKFHDLEKDGRFDQGPELRVMLEKSENDMQTQGAIDRASASIDFQDEVNVDEYDGMVNGKMFAFAKAETYFYRATDLFGNRRSWARGDRKREYGNLYNPYWQVRLADTSDAERLTALGLAGYGF